MSINYTGSGGGIPRKTAKIFAENSDTNDMTVFGSTLANNTTYSKDLDSIQSSAYETGWRDAVISNLNYPLLSDMNGVQHVLSQQIAYILQHGCPEWNAGTTYYAYDLVASGGIIYTSLIDENTNNPVTDTTKWAVYYNPADFLNKKQITNCILEAPENYLTYSGSTITAKAGLKCLIPNGLNDDLTINNIEVTLDSDVVHTISSVVDYAFYDYIIFIDENKQLQTDYAYKYFYVESPSPPINFAVGFAVWFDTNNNIYKVTNDSGITWTEKNWCFIGIYSCIPNTTTITGLGYSKAIRLLHRGNKAEITDWGHPSNAYTSLVLGASGASYFAPTTGYVYLRLSNTSQYTFAYISSNNLFGYNMAPGSGGNVDMYIPVSRGATFRVDYVGTFASYDFKFIYANGEK